MADKIPAARTRIRRTNAAYGPMIPRMLELYEQGKAYSEIVETLTEEGFKCRNGNPLKPNTIRNLILSRVV